MPGLYRGKSTVRLSHWICMFFLGGLLQAPAIASVTVYPVPAEVSSEHFMVSVNGQSSPVFHAAAGYYFLNFDTSSTVTISVTANDAHYWDAGVEVQPMRLGIRPKRNGATITFRIAGPVKLSITRPGDHSSDSEMLFLFADAPELSGINAESPGIRYYGPGVHRGSINAHSGDNIYLAGGAVVFGSLNLWQVKDVHVFGRGTIIYDGSQNPYDDVGWMHRPDWHCIVMDKASNIEIDGITCLVRSRTWQIQMRDSHHIGFYDIKVIGGNPANANQDGMDWLGGGDTTVRDSFFRASDDVFALQGNWEGYSEQAMLTPGHNVANITIEDSVVSTSISNIVRVGWPQKTFNSAHFHMNNVDVIHSGIGACKATFAFFELWADPTGAGSHRDFTFNNIRLEDWYSLVQVLQVRPKVRDIVFSDISAMDGPGMVPSKLKGDVSGVVLQDVNLGSGNVQQAKDVPLTVIDGAEPPTFATSQVNASFVYRSGLIRPKQKVKFSAIKRGNETVHYRWLMGDGTTASGPEIRHVFPDAQGTLLDGTRRFRVLLHVWDDAGHQTWSTQSVVVAAHLQPPAVNLMGVTSEAGSNGAYIRYVDVPTSGGYTFTLLSSTEASLAIDGLRAVKNPEPRQQVCGSKGNAVQPTRVSLALAAGWHRIAVIRGSQIENAETANGAPLLLWEGPGIARQVIPDSAYFRAQRNAN